MENLIGHILFIWVFRVIPSTYQYQKYDACGTYNLNTQTVNQEAIYVVIQTDYKCSCVI